MDFTTAIVVIFGMDDAGFVAKVLDWLIAPLTAYAGYLHNRMTRTDDKLSALELNIAKEYVTAAEHDKVTDKIDAKLDLILEKLDKKADKY